MPTPERAPERVSFERPFLSEGEPIGFTLKSLTSDGQLKEQEISDVLGEQHQGQFRGDVWFLKERPWIIKTAHSTKTKYGVPLRVIRSVNENLRPFLPQHFEIEAQKELVGQKTLKLLVEGYFGERYYLPEAIGYTFLPGIGYAQVIEKIKFNPPHTPGEIEQIFQAQEELTEFCSEAGLIELSWQIHKGNPLAPPNLAFLEGKSRLCWLDTLSGIKMRKSGYVPPVFFFSSQREICRQTEEEGEPLPAFNRIHTFQTRAFIQQEEVEQRIGRNIGQTGLDKLEDWLRLYESILEKDERIRGLSRRQQWREGWKRAPDIPSPIVERVERSGSLYFLARIFGIRTVRYFLDEAYRKWVNEGWLLPKRRKEKWTRFKKRQIITLRQDFRVGPDQQLESNLSFMANLATSKTLIIRPWMQRLAVDPKFRNLEKVARHFVLSGVREAEKNNVVSSQELEELEQAVSLEKLGKKKIGVYLTTFLGQQAIARGADVFEIGNYLAAALNLEPRQALIGFLGGWVAPVLARAIFVFYLQEMTDENLSTVLRWNLVPKLGHYVGVPDQIGATLGDPRIRNLTLRSRLAKILSLWPTSGWGTKSELQLWKKLGLKLEV